MIAEPPSKITAEASASHPAPRRRRRSSTGQGVTRKLGMFSAPAGLLALCVAMGGAFLWGLSGAMGQVRAAGVELLMLEWTHHTALFAFPVLTPLALIAVHRMHWPLMRPWLRGVVKIVLGVWALSALLMAYALL